MVREVRERWHQERLDIRPRLSRRRRGSIRSCSAATAVLLRDVTVDTLITDVPG